MKKTTEPWKLCILMGVLDILFLKQFYDAGQLAFAFFVMFAVAMNLMTLYICDISKKRKRTARTVQSLRYRIPYILSKNGCEKGSEDCAVVSAEKKMQPVWTYKNANTEPVKFIDNRRFLKEVPFAIRQKVKEAYFNLSESGYLIVQIHNTEILNVRQCALLEEYLKKYLAERFAPPFVFTDAQQVKWAVSLNRNYREIILERYPDLNREECWKLLKQHTQRNGLRIKSVDETPSLLDSKLGGQPYLPLGEERPKDSYGHPMGLLIQLNMKQIRLEGFPQKGIFEVFCTDYENGPFESAVRYFKDDLQPSQADDGYYIKGYYDKKEQKIFFEECACYSDSFDPHFPSTMKQLIAQHHDFEIKNMNELNLCELINFTGINFNSWDESLNPTKMVGGCCGFQSENRICPHEKFEKLENIVRLIIEGGYKYDSTPIPLCIAIDPQDLKEGNLEKAQVFYNYSMSKEQ